MSDLKWMLLQWKPLNKW